MDLLYDTKENKKICKKCKSDIYFCSHCCCYICITDDCINQYVLDSCIQIIPSKRHQFCIGSRCSKKEKEDKEEKKITCNVTEICKRCEPFHSYDMISDNVAVGSWLSPYHPFDIVINLAREKNKLNLGEIKLSYEKRNNVNDRDKDKEEKRNIAVISVGINDYPTEEKSGLTVEMIKKILDLIEMQESLYTSPKILFQCKMGISRSTTMALIYLEKKEKICSKDLFEKIIRKRPRMNPNNYFRKILGLEPRKPFNWDLEIVGTDLNIDYEYDY